MSKPFELDELLSRVKNLLQANRGKSAVAAAKRIRESVPKTEFGQVTVDFETHEVTVNDKSVRMTPKELKLLRYFVENHGRVISRNELLTEVWDLSGDLQTRAVDQFIARLRKIIEIDSSFPLHLLTIRDAGYRFVPVPNAPSKSEPKTKAEQQSDGAEAE